VLKERFSLLTAIKQKSLIRDTVLNTFLTLAGNAVGFLVPLLIAAWYGISGSTDVYFFSIAIINFLAFSLSLSLEGVIVPYINEVRSRGEDIGEFLGSIFLLGCLVIPFLCLAIVLISWFIIPVITQFTYEDTSLIKVMVLELCPFTLFLICSSLVSGSLNALKLFSMPALSPAIRAGVSLIIIFLFKDSWGVHALVLGYLIGEYCRFLALSLYLIVKKPFSLNSPIRLWGEVRDFAGKVSYQMLGLTAANTNPLVDVMMASWLGTGFVSVLEYAVKLYWIPLVLLSRGLVVTLLTYWSERYYKGDQDRFHRNVSDTSKRLGILSGFIMVGLILFHDPLINMVYGHGKFDNAWISTVGWVWVCYLAGLLPAVIGFPLSRALLVLKDTRRLFQIFLGNIFLNFFFNLILMQYIGIYGIGISTALVNWFTMFFMLRGVQKGRCER